MEDATWATQALLDAGWNPENPFTECLHEIARPPMPSHLSEADKEGIHFLVIRVKLLARLKKRDRWSKGRSGAVQAAAAGFVAISRRGHADVASEDLVSQASRLQAWERDRYRPSWEKVQSCRTLEDARRCEPAFSSMVLVDSLGLVDISSQCVQKGRRVQQETDLSGQEPPPCSLDGEPTRERRLEAHRQRLLREGARVLGP